MGEIGRYDEINDNNIFYVFKIDGVHTYCWSSYWCLVMMYFIKGSDTSFMFDCCLLHPYFAPDQIYHWLHSFAVMHKLDLDLSGSVIKDVFRMHLWELLLGNTC